MLVKLGNDERQIHMTNFTLRNSPWRSLLLGILVVAACIFYYVYLYPAALRLMLIHELSNEQKTVDFIDPNMYFEEIIISPQEILQHQNRRNILREVVQEVTRGAESDFERSIEWTTFLQSKLVHPEAPPLLDNGQAVYDPIWILQNRLAQCGQANRLILDGLETLGISGRLVQLNGHVIAEVFVDDNYVSLDANMLDTGVFFGNVDGHLPSAMEIHLNPSLLRDLYGNINREYEIFGNGVYDQDYWYNFMLDAFSGRPFYYYKEAEVESLDNEYYGWNYYRTDEN